MKAELLIAADFLEQQGFPASALLRREPSFVTGSRAYGTPRYPSDVDLVIWVSEADLEILKAILPTPKTMRHVTSFHVGRLNLLCCTDHDVYAKWREGTDQLIARKPVTKAQAIALFAGLFGETLADEDAFSMTWHDS